MVIAREERGSKERGKSEGVEGRGEVGKGMMRSLNGRRGVRKERKGKGGREDMERIMADLSC